MNQESRRFSGGSVKHGLLAVEEALDVEQAPLEAEGADMPPLDTSPLDAEAGPDVDDVDVGEGLDQSEQAPF